MQEREKVHGDFADDASLSQELKALVHDSYNWKTMSPVHREALDLICTKIARVCVGNPNHKDHFDDIAGYALLVSKRL